MGFLIFTFSLFGVKKNPKKPKFPAKIQFKVYFFTIESACRENKGRFSPKLEKMTVFGVKK